MKENYKDVSLMVILLKFIACVESFNGPLFEEKVLEEVNTLYW